MGKEVEVLPEVSSYLQSLTDLEIAEFVAKKHPSSLRQAEALVAELTAPPLLKRCFACFAGDDDYGNWLRGTVNGRPVSILLSQNSNSFVSLESLGRLGLSSRRCRPFRVSFLAGEPTPVHNREVGGVEFELEGGYKGRMDFAVMRLFRHDFILGNELLQVCSEAIYKDAEGMKVDLGLPNGQKFTSLFYQGRPQF